MNDDGKIRTCMMLYFQLFDQSNVLYHISAYSNSLIRGYYSRTSDFRTAFSYLPTSSKARDRTWTCICNLDWLLFYQLNYTCVNFNANRDDRIWTCKSPGPKPGALSRLGHISISHNFLHVESARFYLTFFKWPTWTIAFHTIANFGREFFGSPRIL